MTEEHKRIICKTCNRDVWNTILGQCENCHMNRMETKQEMNKGEILVTIHNMRGEYAHEQNESLKRIGKVALEGAPIMRNTDLAVAYYEAQAKVVILDELLEKIASEK